MKDNSTIPTLAQTASGMALPAQLAQQAADAVRELGFCRDTCKSAPQISNNSLSTMA